MKNKHANEGEKKNGYELDIYEQLFIISFYKNRLNDPKASRML